jgi:uncharacterized protein (TIGR03083 family)
MATIRDLATQERSELADMLSELTPPQWSMPSLCAGWTVRQVVAHTIAYLGQSRTGLLINMTRRGWDVDRLNAAALGDYADVTPDRLVELVRDGLEPSGAGALFGGRVALIECLIHQQDIRRPLGMPRIIATDRLRVSLDYARISPVIGGSTPHSRHPADSHRHELVCRSRPGNSRIRGGPAVGDDRTRCSPHRRVRR